MMPIRSMTPVMVIGMIMLAALSVVGLVSTSFLTAPVAAQEATAIPPQSATTATTIPRSERTPTAIVATLVPPTPLPTMTPTAVVLPESSGLAQVQRTGVLRVGTYFNAYPFAWLDEQGEVTGYEAEIVRNIAADLGIEVEFVQVTRHNALAMLSGGQVDVLIGQQIQSRDRQAVVDYTHPYFANQERMVVQTDAPYYALQDLAGLPVSVEVGSRSERALRDWITRTGVQYDVRTYLSESAALDALASGEVKGMVGELDSLRRAGRQRMRLIDEPVLEEYYAMVVRRGDVNLRDVLNRSIQRLKASGRLEAMFATWFPDGQVDFVALIPIYENLFEDSRALGDFPTDIPYPSSSVIDRIEAGLPIRVAGVVPFGEDAPAGLWVINELNRALVEEMARRWGVQVEFLSGSAVDAVEWVADGRADVAVGVTPVWDGAVQVDYSQAYLCHGDRLLVPQQTQIAGGFVDMRGTGWWVGYFADDPRDADLIKKYAEFFGVEANLNEPYAIQREEDALHVLTVQRNVDVVFGDSLRFLGIIRKAGEVGVNILPTPYGDDKPVAFAVPRNDVDFRALVDFTLQDMARDGAFQTLWATYFGDGDPIPVLYWSERNPDGSLVWLE